MQTFLRLVKPSNIVVTRAPHLRQLKCPRCKREATIDRDLEVDAVLRCLACSAVSEFRQYREAWCASRRAELRQACPELHYGKDRLGGF